MFSAVLKGCLRTGRVFCILVILFVFVGGNRTEAQVLSEGNRLEWERENALLAHQFVHIATTSEIGKSTHFVTKWAVPLVVQYQGKAKKEWINELQKHLALLNKLGINIRLKRASESTQNTNVHIYFQSRRDFDSRARTSWPSSNLPTCHVLNKFGKSVGIKGKITAGDIFIPTDLTFAKVRECIAEEITQLLGLVNDSYALPDSLFNDENVYDRLSWTDQLFVRLLYRDNVKPGMSDRELYDVTLTRLNQLRPNFASSQPFQPDYLLPTIQWESLVKDTLQVLSVHSGTSVVKKQLALAKKIDPGGPVEGLAHKLMSYHYLYTRDYAAMLFHARRSYEIIKVHVHPHSLRHADVLYLLSISLRYNQRRNQAERYLAAAQDIIDRFWTGNPLTELITIREIGSLLKQRRFEEVVAATENLLPAPDDAVSIRAMNVVYFHGLAKLGLRDFDESQEDLRILSLSLDKLRPYKRASGEQILASFRHHFQQVAGGIHNGKNLGKKASLSPAGALYR